MRSPDDLRRSADLTVAWLEDLVVRDARGDDDSELETPPAGRYWLGRLASEEVAAVAQTSRGERMDPCAVGVRVRPRGAGPWRMVVEVGTRVWTKAGRGEPWRKTDPVVVRVETEVRPGSDPRAIAQHQLTAALTAAGAPEHRARIEVESVQDDAGGHEVLVCLVNETPEHVAEGTLYETWLELEPGAIDPYVLDDLPDSFRYDRRVEAFGIGGGVRRDGPRLRTTDATSLTRQRPTYWDAAGGPMPDLSFAVLAKEPMQPLEQLIDAAASWGDEHWSPEALDARSVAEDWSAATRAHAGDEARRFVDEVDRLRKGLEALRQDDLLRRAFQLMNEAMVHSSQGRYPGWRPFQIGFQLGALPSLLRDGEQEREIVDTLWFATGGGKTETYLGIVVTACLLDRLRGKQAGVTAWSRFPLRMLSLQQMQRFADALAGAELARRRHDLGGAPFRLGFFVGAAGTPNRIREDPKPGAEDADDPDMPGRYKRLERCPFCHGSEVVTEFDARRWLLVHRCTNPTCTEDVLPVHVVDEEIYRLLPSVIVGTLDKAASVAWQAAMRGLVTAPLARCKGPMHGYRYAKRSSSNWEGCLVPDCSFGAEPLGQDRSVFAPSIRVQDELHLLRDSLGAVDAQYETLLDQLATVDGGQRPKIIASSATLAGHDEQVWALYRRQGRVFPSPGPRASESFWTQPTDRTLRRFVGLAPRGQTLEYASDRIAAVLQRNIRRLADPLERIEAATEIGAPEQHLEDLLSLYGTQVVYGSRLRDVEAAARSFGSEIPVTPLEHVTLTGATPFDEVRSALERLGRPEEDFDDRIHLVAASSMMSHGVDIDRLNVITMLGLPLTTAEFIQTTARIGRTHPGLVIVLHRMGGERDASVYRAFETWVAHGDRFVEPVPITRRSRRVVELAFPGAFVARVYGVHEPRALALRKQSLSKASRLGRYLADEGISEDDEYVALLEALAIDPDADPALAAEVRRLTLQTFRALEEPGDRNTIEICGERPMTSLRDVEAQAPIVEYQPGRRTTR